MGLFSREPEDPVATYQDTPAISQPSRTLVTFCFSSGQELEVISPCYEEIRDLIQAGQTNVIDCVDIDGDRHGVLISKIDDFYEEVDVR